jgi:predicted RNase H-like HicB family nuclease
MEKEKVMRYGYVMEKTKTGFSAYVPDLPGCVATGKTKEQVRRRLQEAVGIHLKSMMESGNAIPEPTSKLEYVEVQLAS